MVISDFKLLERILKPIQIYNLYHFRPVKGFSLDSRSIKKKNVFFALKGKHYDGHDFIKDAVAKGAGFIVSQKYIPLKKKVPFFIVEDSYQAIAKAATYIRKVKKPFIYGITGSVGKTTTKEMLSFLIKPHSSVLKSQKTENNILGLAKTFFSLKDEKILILELGTSNSGEIKTLSGISKPDVGIITSIKPTHLKGLNNLDEIFKEKTSLLKSNPRMKVILNNDDSYLLRVRHKGEIYWFGKGKNCQLFARLLRRYDNNSLFLIQDKYELSVPIHQEIFITNILAAILGASFLGIPIDKLVSRISTFRDFPPMRMEAKRIKGFSILNDAYNANPYSFSEAFRVLENYTLLKIAVVADMLELGKKSDYYHKKLAKQILKADLKYCLIYGAKAKIIFQKLREMGYKKAYYFKKHRDIAEFINKKAGKNKERYLIFLKGSRMMRLEKILDFLN